MGTDEISGLANREQYLAITGRQSPHKPPTANDYTSAGLPWFDYYNDSKVLAGSDTLSKLSSIAAKVIEKGKGLLPDNEPVQLKIVKVINKGNVVRDGEFGTDKLIFPDRRVSAPILIQLSYPTPQTQLP